MATFKIVSQATGKVLDVPGSNPANGVEIQQFTDNGGANQQWFVVPVQQAVVFPGPDPQDLWKIISNATGKALDVPGSNPADGVKIQQFTDNGGANQHWYLVQVDELVWAGVSFHTNDEDKDADTHVTVTVRQSDGLIAARVAENFGGFPDNSDKGPFDFTFINASTRSALHGGTVTIRIDPNGDDTWRFNFSVDLHFSDGSRFLSAHDGVELTADMREQTFDL
jgi:Ricin-type beta-trefoil lectin domain-like